MILVEHQPGIENARFTGKLFVLPDEFVIRSDLKTVVDLASRMNARLRVGRSTLYAKAATGEPYVEFASGVRLNGKTEAAADEILLAWIWRAFDDYLTETCASAAALHPPSLYWRIWPELATFDANANYDPEDHGAREPEMTRRIDLRYLISAKPEKAEFFELR